MTSEPFPAIVPLRSNEVTIVKVLVNAKSPLTVSRLIETLAGA
jgi:hypothetical protein